MAALPYMQLYVADYLADTMHLDAEEHGAYLLLLMNYWQTGKPIPKNRLQKIARVPNERWPTVEQALSEFFNETGADWVHDRVERDLSDVLEAQNQRVRAGKASAEARKRAKRTEDKRNTQREDNDRSTTVQRKANEVDTDTDTDTDTDRKDTPNGVSKKRPKKAELDYSSWPEMPSQQTLDDWHAMRKRLKANVSQTVINRFASELLKAVEAGISVDFCLQECVTRNWRGFEFQWVINQGVIHAGHQSNTSGAQEQLSTVGRASKAAERRRQQIRARMQSEDGRGDGDLVGEDGSIVRGKVVAPIRGHG